MNVIEETSGKKIEPKKSLSSQTDDVLHNIRAIIDQIQEGKRHNYEVGDYYHSGYGNFGDGCGFRCSFRNLPCNNPQLRNGRRMCRALRLYRSIRT